MAESYQSLDAGSALARWALRETVLATDDLHLLKEALLSLDEGFSDLPDNFPGDDPARLRSVLLEVASRLRDNFPYPHPLYAGQMLKPPHPVARLAYMLAMWINPNNHALDGGRASSAMEKEAVAGLAAMMGWEEHLGHLTGGGTMANLEALWIAGRCRPGEVVVASDQAHYTHGRISDVLRLSFEAVPSDRMGRMDVAALRRRLEAGGVGTVVATLGTTGSGAVDPLPEILSLKEEFRFRLHVDAAYGGYFRLAGNLSPAASEAFRRIPEADSIVIDPHKHGLQPYGCGCVLFRDPAVGSHYKHDSPYTYFTSAELHLGEISLECSRAGASAVALWATQRVMPLLPGGELASGLEDCHRAALELHGRLESDERFLTWVEPELDIVLWAPRAGTSHAISQESRRTFDEAARHDLHLALIEVPVTQVESSWTAQGVEFQGDSVTCLRSCLMKHQHRKWIDAIWDRLDRIARV